MTDLARAEKRLAAVAALPEAWRASVSSYVPVPPWHAGYRIALIGAANDLDAALADPEPADEPPT